MDKIYTLTLGELATNCYIIEGEDNKAAVIDPASSTEVLMFLQNRGLTLGSIILTHGHFDHFAGVPELVRSTGCEVIGSKGDEEMYKSAAKSWADFLPRIPFEPAVPDRFFSGGESFSACGLEFRAMAAPGHTAGSCLLFLKTEDGEVIFAGDTVFCGSVGRVDGYSGSAQQQRETLRSIFALDGDYTIYCGHGEPTTLSAEKRYNPFFTMI